MSVNQLCFWAAQVSFQSLFSWKYNCEHSRSIMSAYRFVVSILVFMEVQL
ncbi:Uncharacterized protein dnl_30630 [Desulfonema limicola]|uniref:Uncharacterized protein n=1 Tax=Desulfonema limicola TaxID=45656 RepID=A0A975B8X3_9BACT|nr:Uncharacterized protein dnl_30630 [Desulfonema limicola]